MGANFLWEPGTSIFTFVLPESMSDVVCFRVIQNDCQVTSVCLPLCSMTLKSEVVMSTSLHGVTSMEIVIFIFTALRTSNPKNQKCNFPQKMVDSRTFSLNFFFFFKSVHKNNTEETQFYTKRRISVVHDGTILNETVFFTHLAFLRKVRLSVFHVCVKSPVVLLKAGSQMNL
jgi:hypothetical protein